MKYFIGSLIITFGILMVGVIVLNAMNIKATDDTFLYLGIAWAVLAVLFYPFAKKIMR